MIRGALALIPLGWLVASCTVVLDPGEDQCETDADCTERGFTDATCANNLCIEGSVADPVWGCLGDVPDPQPDPSKHVEVTLQFTYAIDGNPVPTSTVIDVCDKLDIECMGTNPDFPKGLHPDDQGFAGANVPEGFDGFIRITHSDLMPSRVYVGRPILEQPKYNVVRLLRPAEFDLLTSLADVTVDPERGTAILVALDCSGDRASGVRFECPSADTESQEFYLINDSPVSPPDVTSTDADGFGGFVNLPLGAAVAKTFRAEDDAYIGQSSFQVLENTISYVLVSPTPP
ncbi:MAG: hypothetical protein HOW73_05575 [Polyangiaceae bacterium]|nr:hypothetical protein [Polyangiaceae bacterium]